MAAWLGWLQLGMCFWGSAFAPRSGGNKLDHPKWMTSPWEQLMRSWHLNTKKACWLNLFVCSIGKVPVTLFAAFIFAGVSLSCVSISEILYSSPNDCSLQEECATLESFLVADSRIKSLTHCHTIVRITNFLQEIVCYFCIACDLHLYLNVIVVQTWVIWCICFTYDGKLSSVF